MWRMCQREVWYIEILEKGRDDDYNGKHVALYIASPALNTRTHAQRYVLRMNARAPKKHAARWKYRCNACSAVSNAASPLRVARTAFRVASARRACIRCS